MHGNEGVPLRRFFDDKSDGVPVGVKSDGVDGNGNGDDGKDGQSCRLESCIINVIYVCVCVCVNSGVGLSPV
jgi:hypothetical protein